MAQETPSSSSKGSTSLTTTGLFAGVAVVAVLGLVLLELPQFSGNADLGRAAALSCALLLAVAWLGSALLRERRRSRAMVAMLAERDASLAQLRTVFDEAERLSRCGSWIVDREGRLTWCSQHYLDLLQVSAEDRPRTVAEFIRRFVDDPAQADEATANIVRHEAGQPTEGIRRIRLGDGSVRWIQFRNIPHADANGQAAGLFGIGRDVTDEREAYSVLAARTAALETAKLIAGLGTWIWYAESDVLVTCDYMRRIYGTNESNHPKSMLEWAQRFMPADDFEKFLPVLGNKFGGLPFDRERRLITADGRQKWIRSIAEPVFEAAGKLSHYNGVSLDITPQKEALLELARRTEQLEEAQRLGRMGSWQWQPDTDRFDVSAEYRHIFEVEAHAGTESLADWIDRFYHPEEKRGAWSNKQRAAAGEALEARRRIITAKGNHRWIETISHPVRDSQGRVVSVAGVTRDITDRQNAELAIAGKTSELARANRQLEVEVQQRQELERNILTTIEMELAQVGLELHDELGQDLTGIALLTKSLERRLLEKHPEYAADAARISVLVNRTIRHTRMISHGLSPYIWGSDGLIAAIMQLAGDINSLGVVDCRTDLDASISIRDEIAARSLYRIAQEATNNALKHGRAQTITLSLKQRGQGVQLMIEDDGVGGAGTTLEPGGVGSSRFHSIRHRCSAIGAALSVRHGSKGGTSVKIRWIAQSHSSQSGEHSISHLEVF
jgi:PAS domain S-box-containing protein